VTIRFFRQLQDRTGAPVNFLNNMVLGVSYHPDPTAKGFLERSKTQTQDGVTVTAAALSDREAERFFGVPMGRRGMQPVWLSIENQSAQAYRLRLASVDPDYFPALEAAYLNHFQFLKRLIGYGLFIWFLFPFWMLLPLKCLGALFANQRMNDFFRKHGLGWSTIWPGKTVTGFVFTTHDLGSKSVNLTLLGDSRQLDFSLILDVPGLRLDHGARFWDDQPTRPFRECDEGDLPGLLESLPRSTTNRHGQREGDPLNLAVVGDFETVLQGFGARWDETEVITLASCIRTAKAFLLGTPYRYSPVSALYFQGRPQDFALQRARHTINQRLHLRLWMTDWRVNGDPVWIGQISRDIGVRFTLKAWNLTTHKIDPDVDDGRDFLLDDLWESGRVSTMGYVNGAQAASRESPRHNLTGDPYFTDGLRALIVFSRNRVKPKFVDWSGRQKDGEMSRTSVPVLKYSSGGPQPPQSPG